MTSHNRDWLCVWGWKDELTDDLKPVTFHWNILFSFLCSKMPSMSNQAIYGLNFLFLMRFMGRMKTWKSKLDSSSLYNRASLSARFFFATLFASIHKYLNFLPKGGHLKSTWLKIKTMKCVFCPAFYTWFHHREIIYLSTTPLFHLAHSAHNGKSFDYPLVEVGHLGFYLPLVLLMQCFFLLIYWAILGLFSFGLWIFAKAHGSTVTCPIWCDFTHAKN